ncbi:hypothetical protein FTO68_04900 [Methanocalculus taiwanensis]|uniref:Uncharacterized protein n=1 Tax=Methanocalculus taiwanensis TaxID=106207 RepID=A0ABD4TK70_9EURY|nr:hypothetical protein [Methanocalculus taiwanensis]MCQ1538328.1 hypothetical protein [Methanocalculus taiwanensis]
MADDIVEEDAALPGDPVPDIPVSEDGAATGGEEALPTPENGSMVPDAFIRDLKAFGESIRKNPGLVEQIRDVFEYHLVDMTDRRTFSRIVNALTMILGHSSTMVVATACHINAAPFFTDIQKQVGEEEEAEVIAVLQHLTALYGNRVQEAYALSVGSLDEDWFTADINTFRREGEQNWMIELRLALYNGTIAHLKMTPESLFQLTLIMMNEVKKLPAEAFDQEMVGRYGDDIQSFAKRFSLRTDDGTPPGYA